MYSKIRLKYYDSLIKNPDILKNLTWQHAVALVKWANARNFYTGLATMSHREQAHKVLKILGLNSYFDIVATVDDVKQGKPNPEIYDLIAKKLHLSSHECVVIEDSLAGVRAAHAAQMKYLVVPTQFTRESIQNNELVNKKWIINEPKNLHTTLEKMITEENRFTIK